MAPASLAAASPSSAACSPLTLSVVDRVLAPAAPPAHDHNRHRGDDREPKPPGHHRGVDCHRDEARQAAGVAAGAATSAAAAKVPGSSTDVPRRRLRRVGPGQRTYEAGPPAWLRFEPHGDSVNGQTHMANGSQGLQGGLELPPSPPRPFCRRHIAPPGQPSSVRDPPFAVGQSYDSASDRRVRGHHSPRIRPSAPPLAPPPPHHPSQQLWHGQPQHGTFRGSSNGLGDSNGWLTNGSHDDGVHVGGAAAGVPLGTAVRGAPDDSSQPTGLRGFPAHGQPDHGFLGHLHPHDGLPQYGQGGHDFTFGPSNGSAHRNVGGRASSEEPLVVRRLRQVPLEVLTAAFPELVRASN